MDKLQADFRKSLVRLKDVNTLVIHQNKEYIIFFMPSTVDCTIQACNGYEMWRTVINFDLFEQKRKATGLEGSYLSYFDMLAKSITGRNFEVNLDGEAMTITLFFQMNKGVSLKGDFQLGTPVMMVDAKDYHCLYRSFMFDLFRAKDQERAKIIGTSTSTKKSRKPKPLEENEIFEEDDK